MSYIAICILLVFLALLFIYFNSKNISKKMNHLSNAAISDAKNNHNVDLDMNESSLESVNLILQKLHNQNTGDTQNLSMMYGAYIGMFMVKLYNDGVWLKNHPSIGRNTYPLKFSNGQTALPVMWARDHLSNGEDNNVLYKFISFKHARND